MNSLIDKATEDIVVMIGNTTNLSEAFELYSKFHPLLKKYKFIFSSDNGGVPGYTINKNFSSTGAIRGLFETEHVFVFDEQSFHEMKHGRIEYPIDYSVSLDTNAMSYLYPYISGIKKGSQPIDLNEVFDFVSQSNVNIDPMPYCMENYQNIKNNTKVNKIFENLKAYEILRNIDIYSLKNKGIIRSYLPDEEITYRAQNFLSTMYFNIEDSNFLDGLDFYHKSMYVCLVKMVSIQIKYSNHSFSKKMEAFLDFCHQCLATMNGREAAIAHAYFRQGQKLKFFGKIQKKQKNIFNHLKNMAWDLWHIRQLEQNTTFKLNDNSRYYFPAILTFDKNLIEIIDLYPINAIAYHVDKNEPLVFPKINPFNLNEDIKIEDIETINKYFSDDAKFEREKNRNKVRGNLNNIVKELESELFIVAELSGI
ncbi:hypothetical protein DMB99_17035 [Proteus mirabilis]|uniref:hypothetical protein n=1 Tax=Proteus mirabilis TaxID=584 RepID=UPI000D73AD71|nr:hypothetical protein [Proteus mirabilis]EKW2646118.1 hypothetical protein [Proteus mirabilis]ELA7721640.1 hypothetical protein [Proteus mirabilis]ELA9909250.1 hypothetical protein [Proteus mirabilis]MDC9764276.1 hypothetical protein [Proteus mirabilis]PXA24120.1 hypothetical protein DMB99_17035 [Proteus mirabilis]